MTTTEEAIKNIKEHCYFANLIPQAKEALDMAIKALEQEPCDDCVSRQAVLDIVNNPLNIRLDEIIKKLPPVTPQPKTAHWITLKDAYGDVIEAVCSNCDKNGNHKWSLCPYCGAIMIESQESEEAWQI